jgi:hypothetical protein
VCVRVRARAGVRARRGGHIHTLDGNIKCVLHTCMTLEAVSTPATATASHTTLDAYTHLDQCVCASAWS